MVWKSGSITTESGFTNSSDILEAANHGSNSDVLFTIGENSSKPYYNIQISNGECCEAAAGGFADNWECVRECMVQMPTDIRIVNTANEIIKNNNVGSIHLIGYSTGSVVMAQTALYLYKEKGIKVTSLLLIGTPIHKNSELWKELINLGIAFYYYDIPGDDVKLKKLSVLSFAVQGNNHSHFALAFGKEAQKKRKKLFNNYYQQLNTKH